MTKGIEDKVLARLDERKRVASAPNVILRQVKQHVVRADQEVVVAFLDCPERDRPQIYTSRGAASAR